MVAMQTGTAAAIATGKKLLGPAKPLGTSNKENALKYVWLIVPSSIGNGLPQTDLLLLETSLHVRP